MPKVLIFFALLLPLSSHAEWRSLGTVQAERFDASMRAWLALPVRLAYRAEPETIRVQVPNVQTTHGLTLRLDFKRLPHYDEWLRHRQAQGGASWVALRSLLDELGDGPAMALSSEPIAAPGSLTLKLGLRRASRFELYATVSGPLEVCGPSLCFEPQEPLFASQSASLAWKLLKPLARTQAKSASQR